MNTSLSAAIGVFIAAATLLTTWMVMAVRHNNRVQGRIGKLETEMTYIRRDLDQILRLYRLVPASEQERRRRLCTGITG